MNKKKIKKEKYYKLVVIEYLAIVFKKKTTYRIILLDHVAKDLNYILTKCWEMWEGNYNIIVSINSKLIRQKKLITSISSKK